MIDYYIIRFTLFLPQPYQHEAFEFGRSDANNKKKGKMMEITSGISEANDISRH